MNEATFWKLIDDSRRKAGGDATEQIEVLQAKLQELPPEEILDYERIFRTLHARAYTWDLWAAAYIIEGGCSDDGFAYFRAGLIALGRSVYEAALENPESLAKLPTEGVDFSVEEMSYVGTQAYEQATGEELPEHAFPVDPADPIGERFDEDTVDERFPKLATKFG